MVCVFTCGISLLFLISMLFMTFGIDNAEIKKKFISKLSSDEKKQYELIIEERRSIYLTGFILGIVIAFLIASYVHYRCFAQINLTILLCLTGCSCFFTTYFYYILKSKKNNLMVIQLNSVEKREEWAHIYRAMQYNYHIGLFFGLIAVILFIYSIYHEPYRIRFILAKVDQIIPNSLEKIITPN